MRIRWLDGDEMREALLVRGFWRWRHVAHVKREILDDWQYVPSGDYVEPDIRNKLDVARSWILSRRRRQEGRQRNWQQARALPMARAVEREP